MAILTGNLQLRALMSLPLANGGQVIVTDRSDVADAEDRVEDWGEIVSLISGDADSTQITVSNLPLAATTVGRGRFSEYWSTSQPADNSTCSIEFRTSTTAPWELAFDGAISEVSSITERAVTLHIGSTDERLYRDIGDVITRSEYPQAASDAVDKIKPIILGEVKAFAPPMVRERKTALLQDTILAATTIDAGSPKVVAVDDTTGWPDSGTLKIGDEKFLFDQDTIAEDEDEQIRLVARAQDGTSAQTHSAGDTLEEQANAKWIVAGHAVTAISAVYGVTGSGNLTLIDPSRYTADLGGLTGEASIELVDSGGLTIAAQSDVSVYRRVELDAVTLEKTTDPLEHVPLGFPLADGKAKNAALAAAGAGEWSENTYAIMRQENAGALSLYRGAPVDIPPIQPARVFVAVEHYGIETFAILGVLTEELDDDPTTLRVNFDNSDATGIGLDSFVAVDGEWMAVAAGGADDAGVTLTAGGRGVLGTARTTHGEGAIVRLVRNPPSVGNGRVEIPQVHVFLGSRANESGLLPGERVFTDVGKLSVLSDVPAEVAEVEGYTEATSLSAWHGHVVDGLPVFGKTWNDPSVGWAGLSFQFPKALGDLVVGSVKDSSLGYDKNRKQLMTLSPTGGSSIVLNESGILYHLGPDQSALTASMSQRVVQLRIRLSVSSSSGSSEDFQVKAWVSDAGHNGSPQKVLDVVDAVSNTLTYSSPSQSRTIKIAFDEQNGFPDGCSMRRIMSKDFAIWVSAPDGGVKLHYFAIDLRFDQSQLAGGAGDEEFLNDRAIHIVPAALVMASGDSPFTNVGDPGPSGDQAGVTNYTSASLVHVLASNFVSSFYTKEIAFGVTFVLKDHNGTRAAIVRFSTNAGTDRDLRRVSMHIPNYVTHGNARVYRISLLMWVGVRKNSMAPIVRLIDAEDVSNSPDSVSAGPPNIFDNDDDDVGARLWRWTWNFTGATNILRAKSLHKMTVQVEATGSPDDKTEFFAARASFHIETSDPRGKSVQTTKAEQFTRVNYFDVTAAVATPEAVQNLGVTLAMATRVYDPDLTSVFTGGAGGPQNVVSTDNKSRPIFVHRMWWVFEQRGTEEEDITRIAVDVEGLPLTPGFEGASAIQTVLTFGSPLMSYDPLANINQNSFVAATSAGMHKLRGVIASKVDARELVNDMCKQARVWGFWEAGSFRLLYKHDHSLTSGGFTPRAVFDHSAGHIMEDSLELAPRPRDTITTRVAVNARPDYVKGGFKIDTVAYAPGAELLLGSIMGPDKIDADMLWTQAEADSLADQQVTYRSKAEVLLRFQTSLFDVARGLRRGDLLSVLNHPIVDASATYQVVAINRSFGTLASGIPVYEIEAVERVFFFDAEILGKSTAIGGRGSQPPALKIPPPK